MKKLKPVAIIERSRTIVLIVSIVIIIALSFFIQRTIFKTPRIGFVRSLDLVYNYNGMKQAHASYVATTDSWKANIDTLQRRYKAELDAYNDESKKLSAMEKKERELVLQQMLSDLNKYTAAIQDKAKEAEAQLTESVLNQINSLVEEYAKDHGYDIVFGAEGAGSVVYGNKAYDITDDVLKILNSEFKVLPNENKHVTR